MATTVPRSIGRFPRSYVPQRNIVKETTAQFATIQRLDQYLCKFSPWDEKTYLGQIEKIELDSGSKLILKADIHGDYISLTKYLEGLKVQGYLDEAYNIANEYKGKIVIAFLGDYMDRGPDSFPLLERLLKLKMDNPDEIVLLRGNHEDVNFSAIFINERESHFYQNEQLCEKLQQVFTTMPLACLVGTQTTDQEYEYTLLAHGAFDPDVDLNSLLKIPLKRASTPIRRDKKANLSDRIQDILPDSIKNKHTFELKNEMQALKDFINLQSEENLSKVTALLGIASIDRKQAKLFLSILNVKDFLYNPFFLLDKLLPESLQNLSLEGVDSVSKAIKFALDAVNSEKLLKNLAKFLRLETNDRTEIENILEILYFIKFPENNFSFLANEDLTICKKMESERVEDCYTNFNWGDIDAFSLGENNERNVALKFTPEFLKDYFRIVSTDARKVKAMRSGHAHKHQKFRLNGKKIAETLPVSGGLTIYATFSYGIDYAQIITITRRVKDWLKQSFQRYPAEEEFILSSSKPSFYQKDAL